ncbi:MAG TPA: hypothetical protein DCF33_05390 [Saprospirales bacterium]|nr:hypothetical protein [Saprospirales bacterium]
MKKATINLHYSIEVQWDPNSEAFQRTLESYQHFIHPGAYEETVIIQAVQQAFRCGADRLIEGVGFVKCGGALENETLYSGIDIDDDDPEPIIEVEYQ